MFLLFYFVLITTVKINIASSNRYKNRVLRYDYENDMPIEMRINYPSVVEMDNAKSEKMKVEEKCEFNICENPNNYPENEIKQLLKNSTILKSFFGNVFTPHVDIESRGSFIGDSEPFCKSQIVTRYPREALDINNQVQTILNIDPPYFQTITFEVCNYRDGGSFCHNPALPPINYNFMCKQKYTTIKLMKYVKETKKFQYGEFPIPTSCVCTYMYYS